MVRLVLFLLAVAAAAAGLAWLADRPGSLVVNWQGYEVETSVFRAIVLLAMTVGLAIVAWSVLRQLWHSPAALGHFFTRRRQRRGLEALSSGMIAIGAGDRAQATRYALQARKSLPNEPLTHLLRAQAAQLSGDRTTSRRIFEAMLGAPDTEQLGLRGLFLEAEREGEREAARQFAERAIALNPKLAWPVEALFEIQCKESDWAGALETMAIARRHHHVPREVADRRRAVLLTAQAQDLEDNDPVRATSLALEAHGLAHDLVPAGAIAGRLLAARGNTARAAKVLQRTWKRAPHPDLATAYAYARIGDSPHDRLTRIKQLASLNPHNVESAVAIATAAVEAREFDAARHVLQPLLDSRPTARVCMLMARIEAEQHGDKGRFREWLGRGVSAPRDPAWTTDGVVSERWAPISPVTGALDAFQWRVPVEAVETKESAAIADKIEELVRLGGRPDGALAPPKASDDTDGTGSGPKVAARPEATDADVIEVVAPAQPAATGEGRRPVEPPPRPVAPPTAPDRAPAPGPVEPTVAVKPAPVPGKSAEPKPPVAAQAPSPPPAAIDKAARQGTPPSVEGHRVRERRQPKIFVPSRAPDDPGLDDPDAGEHARSALMPYGSPAKG